MNPAVARVPEWIPSERLQGADVVPLHRNENPYPPPAEVVVAVQKATARMVRLFPDPESSELREAIARTLAVREDQVLVGAGSTELQGLAAQAFLAPGDRAGFPWPTTPYFEHLALMQGAEPVRLPWLDSSPEEALLDAPPDLKVLFLCNPNTPLGESIETYAISDFAHSHPRTLVVIDEAYEAFRGANAMKLVEEGMPNVLIVRSFSKAHALAGLRLGYAIGHPEAIRALRRAKSPYNVDVVAQSAGLAAWRNPGWVAQTAQRIRDTRESVRLEVQMRGFDVPSSDGNFFFLRGTDTFRLYQGLRERGIIVRRYDEFEVRDGVRVSIGTDEQMNQFLAAIDSMLTSLPMRRSSSTMIKKLNFSLDAAAPAAAAADDEDEDAPAPADAPERLDDSLFEEFDMGSSAPDAKAAPRGAERPQPKPNDSLFDEIDLH
ncbi:MAG: histidinol-phosphate transaminase [Candidatus Sumerlaeia bacterium]|nr:histidinol-phosphate transaminase [Candidatus Sumerlaeia bacterium]